MKNRLITILLFICNYGFSQDSISYCTFKNESDALLYNIVINDSNDYPRQDALRYTNTKYDSTLKEFVILLDKVSYKALKDSGIKVKKVKKPKSNKIEAILNDDKLKLKCMRNDF